MSDIVLNAAAEGYSKVKAEELIQEIKSFKLEDWSPALGRDIFEKYLFFTYLKAFNHCKLVMENSQRSDSTESSDQPPPQLPDDQKDPQS